MRINDMLAPPPVHLPQDPAAAALRDAQATGDAASARTAIAVILTDHPTSSLGWAMLAEGEDDPITAYAFARTGYHRGLDALRGSGWKGFGPVPWDHTPNQGVLRAIAALALAARNIGETAEYDRCRALLSDCDPECVARLL